MKGLLSKGLPRYILFRHKWPLRKLIVSFCYKKTRQGTTMHSTLVRRHKGPVCLIAVVSLNRLNVIIVLIDLLALHALIILIALIALMT